MIVTEENTDKQQGRAVGSGCIWSSYLPHPGATVLITLSPPLLLFCPQHHPCCPWSPHPPLQQSSSYPSVTNSHLCGPSVPCTVPPPDHERCPAWFSPRSPCMCLLPPSACSASLCEPPASFPSAYLNLTVLCSCPWILLSHPEYTERTLGKSLDLPPEETSSSCLLLFCFDLSSAG